MKVKHKTTFVRHNGEISAAKHHFGFDDARIASPSSSLFTRNFAVVAGRENVNTA